MSIRIPKADNPDICVHHFTMDGDCPHCERAEKTRDYEREIESLKKENAELNAKLDEAISALENIEDSNGDDVLVTAGTESIVMCHYAREALFKIREVKS